MKSSPSKETILVALYFLGIPVQGIVVAENTVTVYYQNHPCRHTKVKRLEDYFNEINVEVQLTYYPNRVALLCS